MNAKTYFLTTLSVVSLILGISQNAYAACDGATLQGGNHCLYHADMSTLGGDLLSSTSNILAANMYPYQSRSTSDDLKHYHDIASGYLNNGKNFRQSLLLFSDDWNPHCPGTTLKERLFCDPKKNYETEGYVDTDCDNDGIADGCCLTGNEVQQLISARDTFAYQLSIGYYPPGSSLAGTQAKLLDAIKTLANIYLMVADEFLIDGLEFRVSYDTSWQLDDKLAAQILLLQKGGFCYTEGVNSFVYGYSPAVGTNIYASDYFDDDVMSLFNLAVERWSVAWREQGAKERAKGMAPNPAETEEALQQLKQNLRDVGVTTYLLTASLANGQQEAFPTNGGDRLKNALQLLRTLASTANEHMNPLGYDDRYIPMRDFRNGLYDDARLLYQAAVNSYGVFQSTDRDFDFDLNSLLDATEQLANNEYKQQLAQLTGISVNDPQFISKVSVAGEDLYDCSLDADSSIFNQCLQTKTKGYMGIKYAEIRKGRLSTNLALQKKQTLIQQVDLENKRHNQMLEIEHKLDNQRRDLLINFLEGMRKARFIQKKINPDLFSGTKKSVIETVYYFRNDPLQLETYEEIKLQELMRDYHIAQIEATDEVVIQNLLNQIAEAEIESGLAIQYQNSAALDFENTLRQRDDLVFLFNKATEHLNYSIEQLKDKASEVRVLRSEAALEFADDLNFAVHFAYLAAKRLEYEYLKPLVNIAIGPKILNITDLYKVQTVADLDDFLNKLQLYDTCAYGTRQPFRLRVELARNILGLTDEYLNPNGALTPSQVEQLRRQQVQLFIADHLLIDPFTGRKYISFDFSTSLDDSYIAVYPVYNLKIWYGTAAPPCDPVLRSGVAIRFDTTQGSSVEPLVTLKQQGHSTFNNKNRNLVEYTPVNEYLNLQGVSTDNMFITTGVLDTFSGVYINQDPPSSSLWNNAFKGRSVASSSWLMEVKDMGASTIDWGKVTNIIIHMDVLGTPY